MTAKLADIHAAALQYCESIHFSKPDVFEQMCHDAFVMFQVGEDALQQSWDKAAYLERVAGRSSFPGDPSYEILNIDISGAEMARVHLWVDVPPKRYEDHLGFVRVDGGWKLLTKVFRTMEVLS